jgi:hypothetical protein
MSEKLDVQQTRNLTSILYRAIGLLLAIGIVYLCWFFGHYYFFNEKPEVPEIVVAISKVLLEVIIALSKQL